MNAPESMTKQGTANLVMVLYNVTEKRCNISPSIVPLSNKLEHIELTCITITASIAITLNKS